MTWSAKQYTMFEQQRTRPVRDLVAAIPNTDVGTAVDLGCGPGNSTEVLAERFPKRTSLAWTAPMTCWQTPASACPG